MIIFAMFVNGLLLGRSARDPMLLFMFDKSGVLIVPNRNLNTDPMNVKHFLQRISSARLFFYFKLARYKGLP